MISSAGKAMQVDRTWQGEGESRQNGEDMGAGRTMDQVQEVPAKS